MGMGVSLRPCRCRPGLPKALPITGSSPACRAASCLSVLASPARRGRGQVLSTACASSRAGTPRRGLAPTPPSPLSALRSRGSKWRLLHGSPRPRCRWSRSWRRGFACVIPSASGACLAQARLLRGPRRTLRRRARNKDVTWPRRRGGRRWGASFQEGPGSPGRTSPPRWAPGLPAVTLAGGPAGAREGLSPPTAPSQGCGMVWGTQVPRDAGSQVGGGVPPGRGGSHCPAAPPALGGSKARGLPAWWGKVLQRCPSTGGIRTPTAAVPLRQASHPLPPHHTPSLLPVCLSHTSGTGAMWCWAPRARPWQAARAVLHGPRSPFFPLAPWPWLGMARAGRHPGQGGSVPGTGEGGSTRSHPAAPWVLIPASLSPHPRLAGHRAGSWGSPTPFPRVQMKSQAGSTSPTLRLASSPRPQPHSEP